MEGRSLDPLEQRADLGARVEQQGIRVGTVVDVIFDRRLRSLVGYELVGTDGLRRFVPVIACGASSSTSLEVTVPTAILGTAELGYYRHHGVSLADLQEPLRAARRTAPRAAATEVGDGISKVVVAGEADLYTAHKFKTALASVIDGGSRKVLVDLSRVTSFDSTMLDVVEGGVRRLRQVGGEMVIVCADPSIKNIIEITLLDQNFAIFDSGDAATDHLRAEVGPATPAT